MTSPGLLLIRGLGHSGTTILDLALGAHPQVVGLGEAVRILARPAPGEEGRGPAQLRGELRHSRLCTCGVTAAQCPVWGPLLTWLPDNDDQPLTAKLARLMEQVRQRPQPPDAAPVRWLVDSYQADLELPRQTLAGQEVRLLFLVRDVRSWVYSRSRGEGRRRRWRCLARWLHTNRRFETALRRSGRPIFLLGYEELALAPTAALTRLCSWLDLPFAPAMLSPGQARNSHILAGNRLRFDAEQCAAIRYDGAWLAADQRGIGLAAELPPVRAMNRRLVYSNSLL